MVELNTVLRLPKDFDASQLHVGTRYVVVKERERVFPLHVAILIVDCEWNFYGYAVAHSAVIGDLKTEIEFEVLSLFTMQEQAMYKSKFLEAAKKTGEVT